ncbi:MAG: hypothetical protein M1385_00120 [Candidatus Marsarchaeota archaeon]|jgi:hypothetical protein|nr:hypothetical protein [Candidatus Marsarchaeota archaeon]
MGITKLLDAIIGLIIVLAVSVMIWHFYSSDLKTNIASNIAQETAYNYDTFASALNSYVQANFNNNIGGTVSCSTLKADNFLSSSFSCVDPIGETLSGYISSPWGFPQTWLVAPTTTPNPAILSKFNINNPLQWKAFTYLVAQDAMNENQNFKGFSIDSDGQFTMPDSDVISNLSNYFPASNVEFSQTMPFIAYYDNNSIIVAPSIEKKPDYWIFDVSVTEDYNNASPSSSPASITYSNLGSTAVCPADGVTPEDNSSDWLFNPANETGYGLPGPGEIPGQTNYYNFSFYLCIPAAKNIINTSSSIFSNIGPITSLNYGSDEMYIDDNTTFNGANNNISGMAPQVGHVYYITEGMAKYTFVVYWSAFSYGYYNNGSYNGVWGPSAQAAAILWIGEPSTNDISIESDWEQPANGVFPNPAAPIWNAVNDLGLTNINLE